MKRIPMRKLHDTLRLRLDTKLSYRQIQASTKVSVGTIQILLSKAGFCLNSWSLKKG